jgi:hypothetical protein
VTSPITLQIATAQSVFWRGEAIGLQIRILTALEAEPVQVPVPFELSQAGVTLVIRSADGKEVVLEPAHDHASQTRTLPPGDLYETEIALERVHSFEPGSYEVRVEWRPWGMSVLTDTVSFQVAEPTTMTLSIVGPLPADPTWLRAVGTVSGTVSGEPALGALLDLTFGPEIEDDTEFVCTRTVGRYRRTEPLTAAVPVQSLATSADWMAGRDTKGLFARPGFEVQGVARHDWSEDDPPQVVVPGIESEDGLRVFTVTRGGQLAAVEFAPPRVEVEQPSGPDDWDDEILVPGPVSHMELGSIGEGVLGARAVGASNEVYVVAATRGGLRYARLRSHELTQTGRVEIEARVLSTDPAVHSDESGAVVAAVVVAREVPQEPDAPENPDALQIGIARVLIGSDAAVDYRWLGVLESIPVSAAVSFVAEPGGGHSPLSAVLDTEHFLHLGTWSGRWSRVAAPSALLSPLTVTAAQDAPHVAVSTPAGPRLQRL